METFNIVETSDVDSLGDVSDVHDALLYIRAGPRTRKESPSGTSLRRCGHYTGEEEFEEV